MDKVALGHVFLPKRRFVPVSNIPPMLHTHFYLLAALNSRLNGRSLGTFRKNCCFGNRGPFDRTYVDWVFKRLTCHTGALHVMCVCVCVCVWACNFSFAPSKCGSAWAKVAGFSVCRLTRHKPRTLDDWHGSAQPQLVVSPSLSHFSSCSNMGTPYRQDKLQTPPPPLFPYLSNEQFHFESSGLSESK
jgi:hypothetical protein